MAHRGRTYPNHFRRDFNTFCDVSNPNRYAQSYNCTLNSRATPPYIVDGQRFECLEVAGPSPTDIQWLSVARTIGIWLWQLRCIVSFFNLPTAERRPTWILQRDAIDVARWRGDIDPQSNFVGGGAFPGQVPLFLDVTTFDHGANFNYSFVDPVRYPP